MATRKKKQDHCVMGNNCFQCLNCGAKQQLPMPIDIDMFGAMAKQFGKTHKDCKKTWTQPVAEPEGKSEQENSRWWLIHGERGISSETMFHYLSGENIRVGKYEAPPSDPSDFRRCYLLLKTVPQWKEKLQLMKSVSPAWSNLVDNWDKLSEMLEEQMRTDKPNGMYEFMKKLGC